MKEVLWRVAFGLYVLSVFPAIWLYMTYRDIRRAPRGVLTITNEATGEVREIVYRYRWMARVRSWFVAFPNWKLAKVTRVEVTRG